MINFANFNPRSREGSDIFLAEFHQLLCHFNPRSREGSDARSAQETQYRSCISIHAPARGATTFVCNSSTFTSLFQSTLPRGERHATSKQYAGIWNLFQSTLPRGERRTTQDWNITDLQFQSTLPRGERRPPSPVRAPT